MDYEKLLLKALSRINELEEDFENLNKRIGILEKLKIGNSDCVKGRPENDSIIVSKQNSSLANTESNNKAITSNDDIRRAIRQMSNKGEITETILNNFLNEQWCRKNFNLGYPVLREERFGRYDKNNEYTRYWNEVIYVNDNGYYICQEWFPKRRNLFQKWYFEQARS